MSAVLKADQKLRRVIKVYGVELPVTVTLTYEGIEFKVKGAKIGVGNTWAQLIHKGCLTPMNAPSYLAGLPLNLLIDQATKQTKRAVRRLDKKAKETHEAQA